MRRNKQLSILSFFCNNSFNKTIHKKDMIIIKTGNRIINIYYQFIMIYSIQFIFYFCNKIAERN